MSVIKRLLLLILLITATAVVSAQSIAPTEVNPDANITWPPPVYVLRGEVTVRGTANVTGMNAFFLEYRPLNEDLTPQDEDVAWLPATLPTMATVTDDILGVWDTTVEPDGVYELRLRINVTGGDPVTAEVRPLRIENEPPPFAVTATPFPTITPAASVTPLPLPTLPPTPTAFDPTPRVSTGLSANVRAGDSTGYPIVGDLQPGETARLIGRSSTGSGWFYIELPNGTRGWIAGGIVTVSGDVNSVPFVDPPATPTPTASPTPMLPDAAIIGLRTDREIKQGESFQIIVTVRNNNTVVMPDVPVLCSIRPQNLEVSASVGQLNGFEQREVALPIRIDSGGGSDIQIQCAVDVNNIVAETDENNNFSNISVRLNNP